MGDRIAINETMLKPGRKMYRHLILTAIVVSLAACSKNSGPDIGTVSPTLTPQGPQAPSAQGTINGGGGAGLRCGGKLEVLDLYEARKAGLQLVAVPQTNAEAVSLVAVRIANHFWNPETVPLPKLVQGLADDIVAPIMEGRAFKNHATGKEEEVQFVENLQLSNDYGNFVVPSGCHLEQIAYFSDEQTKLLIVKTAWEQLDFLSKSILIAHELFYMVNRREGIETLLGEKAHTSEFTRRFVGRLFAAPAESIPLPSKSDSLPADGRLQRCATTDLNSVVDKHPTYFYAYQDVDENKTTFVFKTVLEHSSPYQLRADFEKQNLESSLVALGATADEADTKITVRVVRNEDARSGTLELFTFDQSGKRSLGPKQNFTCEKL